jgi:hypothetical protein
LSVLKTPGGVALGARGRGRVGARDEEARAHAGLGRAYLALGDALRTRDHLRRSLDRYTDLGSPEAAEVRALLAVAGPPPRHAAAAGSG